MSDENATVQTDTAEETKTVFGGVNWEEIEATARGKVAKGEEPRKFKYQALTANSINRDDPEVAFEEILEASDNDLNRVAVAFIKGLNILSRSENEGMDEFTRVAKDIVKTREKDPSKFAWADGLSLDALVAEVKKRFS
jgi:hypothetical protein